MHSGAPVAQKPNRPPTPLGRESLAYPVFAATDRRLLVVLVPVVVIAWEAQMLIEDLSGRTQEIVAVEFEASLLALAEDFRRRIRQARQAFEAECIPPIPAEALGGRV